MGWSELNEENYIDKINSLSKEDWQPLLSLISEIEKTTKFGEWSDKGKGDGTLESPYLMPYHIETPIVREFVSIAYKIPIMIVFSWMEWAELETFLKDKSFNFDSIDIPTKCKIITAIIRADRFCDGATSGEFESGVVLKILKSIERQLNENI